MLEVKKVFFLQTGNAAWNQTAEGLKVNLQPLLFEGFEVTGFVHERQNVFSILVLNEVDGSRILADLPEMRVVYPQDATNENLVNDPV
jgi:hypothetical protein